MTRERRLRTWFLNPDSGAARSSQRSWRRLRYGRSRLHELDELAHPGAVVGPAADGDEGAVDHDIAVDELGPGCADVGLEVGVAGDRLALRAARRDHEQRAVAVGRDRLARLDEVADDRDGLRLVPQVLGRPAAGQDEAVVGRRVDLVEPEVGLDAVAGLLGVGVEAGLEVVDDREEGPLRRGDDVDLPALFLEAVLGVVDLLRLARVAGQEQDLASWRDVLAACPSRGQPRRQANSRDAALQGAAAFHVKHRRSALTLARRASIQ